MDERESLIALNMVERLGPVRVRALIDTLGDAHAILHASPEDLARASGIGPSLAATIARQCRGIDLDRELRRVARAGAHIVTPLDDDYPAALREIYDPPLALYVRGALPRSDPRAVAVVGSRRCTAYGRACADRLACALSRAGCCVVSGLARGIDTAAHRAALKAGGRTVAVLGSGLERLYPAENASLAEEIAETGAVISEFPMTQDADKWTFPCRNRVISGLSAGTLVVEADERSGAMHTADAALEQGRSVFAVPGRIDSASSRGTHRLIKNGACLVDSIDDIVHEFELLFPEGAAPEPAAARPDTALSTEERRVVEALWEESMDVDRLARKAGMPSHRVSGLLMGLVMKHVIRLLPGRRVELDASLRGMNEEGGGL
ncbi:DNA-processing protein DprA [Kiritimatiella glycovorans]|uniref:DNA protecting protein DprA n=1 Tax=Kiritimatiella glycovorans TaxID=1307763 RepID=A0A0G3EH65_9BACT|nr:DNA-processing protein DprA [Kiritimatiella glycovorans]AKJ64155.1 DNA protecting protein DprA [Kiritimatiella glycovorans]